MTKTTWRSDKFVVCDDMVEPLNEGARLMTVRAKAAGIPDMYVKGIDYFGSYQDGTTASGNIALGGGHADINLVGYSKAQKLLLEAIYREVGFYADIREPSIWSVILQKWFKYGWQSHLHMVKKDCPHRSDLARSQVYQWQVNDADGMAAIPDNDDGPRQFVWQTWSQYKAKRDASTAPKPPVVTITPPSDVLKAIQARMHRPANGIWEIQQDIDMRSVKFIAQEGFTGAFFKKWGLASRKRMQSIVGVTQDGVWGPVTKAAYVALVKFMQGQLKVSADGQWGPVTDAAYMALRKATYRQYDIGKPTGTFPYPKGTNSMYGPSVAGKPWFSGRAAGTLTKAQIQWQISRIQRMIGDTPDGIWDSPRTTDLVKKWQVAHKILADGIVGPKTWAAMVLANK